MAVRPPSPGSSTTAPSGSTAPLGGLIMPLGGLTTRIAEAGGQTEPLGGQTAHVAEVDGPTAHPMTLTPSSMPRAATMTLASLFALRAAPMTPTTTSSAAAISPPAAQPAPRVLPADATPISPVVHSHPMWTQGVASFRQPKHYVAATLSRPKVSLSHPHRSSLVGGYGGRV
jgi:hypothetical protein